MPMLQTQNPSLSWISSTAAWFCLVQVTSPRRVAGDLMFFIVEGRRVRFSFILFDSRESLKSPSGLDLRNCLGELSLRIPPIALSSKNFKYEGSQHAFASSDLQNTQMVDGKNDGECSGMVPKHENAEGVSIRSCHDGA